MHVYVETTYNQGDRAAQVAGPPPSKCERLYRSDRNT